MITIKELQTKKEMETFVKFPFTLYKGNKYWVPPIIKDEMESFNPEANPAFQTAEAKFYGAYKDHKMVGRIAIIVNWLEVNDQKIKKVRFGWFDFIDDLEVSKALLDKVFDTGKHHNLEYAEGPMGFSNLDKVGVLTKGFEELSTMATWYNHAYYVKHYEAYGFKVEKEYVENRFPFANAKPIFFQKAEKLIRKRYNLRPVNFTKTEDVMPYVDKMFDLFNSSYATLSSFVAVTDAQKEYFKKKYISFINPEYIKFVVNDKDELICFGIVMPSFSEALQKANGKLFPFGFLHLLKAKKYSKTALFYLIGVQPEYQNKGVTAILFNEYFKVMSAKGIENCIRTPELADNMPVRRLWKNFDPEVYAERCTFVKDIE
ncbi:hypothetical protein SAMN05216480_102241 [Pustulibacterium marinum]|uniref:Uncharacterized protein n=1 Tax=Pustulibacterium marinum TaxID=1224947 RepID=A0A1I7FUQ0_9FLAO|nr:GNAT family N-acetyltransferase [Pustulibacterium marinum]SFU39746.1 hypothetical protein SAMN05216480_102241 [Pustulibacterium marinum]